MLVLEQSWINLIARRLAYYKLFIMTTENNKLANFLQKNSRNKLTQFWNIISLVSSSKHPRSTFILSSLFLSVVSFIHSSQDADKAPPHLCVSLKTFWRTVKLFTANKALSTQGLWQFYYDIRDNRVLNERKQCQILW